MKVKLIKQIPNSHFKILFLGYSTNESPIISALCQKNCEVFHTSDKITSFAGYDLIVSYGYKHIITKETILSSSSPIINLHISYLPWNRGAHPNFWAFYDNTPFGVTIHMVDDGIDTGPIIYQKHVIFNELETTFANTYRKLKMEIESLFIENLDNILFKRYHITGQMSNGSFHLKKDLPKEFKGWDSNINNEIQRLKELSSLIQNHEKL